MIVNPEWLKPEEKPYFHQISRDCIEKLVECIERFNKGEIDADTSFKIGNKATKPFILGILLVQILTDEFDDPEFLEFAKMNYGATY